MSRTGQLSRQHSRGGIRRGRNLMNGYPLRKVVADAFPYEELECGHRIIPPSDWIGRTYAARRRCFKCGPSPAAGEQR